MKKIIQLFNWIGSRLRAAIFYVASIRCKCLKLFILGYLIGMFVFTWQADFSEPNEPLNIWDKIWGIWQNWSDGSVLAWGSVFYSTKGLAKEIVRWTFYYSLLLANWEIISFWTGLSINNEEIVGFFFGVLAVIVLCLSIWQETWLNKQVTKHLDLN